MTDKPLSDITQAEFDSNMRVVGISSIVVTIGMLLAIGYMVLNLLERPPDTQMTFVIIFLAFILIGVFNLATTMAKQYLRLRKDLWDVMKAVNDS